MRHLSAVIHTGRNEEANPPMKETTLPISNETAAEEDGSVIAYLRAVGRAGARDGIPSASGT